MMMSGRSNSNRYPFSASQWQELEQQALFFFKFMVSGLPIPPDLISSINNARSSQPQHIGWSCFQMGVSRNIDPEPNRCRRTDGKKWRCSREAFGDSKYCERHVHRGKSRPRQPLGSKPLQTFPHNRFTSRVMKAETQYAGTCWPSVTSAMTLNHQCNAHCSKPIKDSNLPTFSGIGIDPAYAFTNKPNLFSESRRCVDYEEGAGEKRQRSMFQFIEEFPREKKGS